MLRILDNLSARPAQDVQEFVRRFVTFILMGNTDAHMKNWALFYPDGITPELTPLYDPVCVTAFFDVVKKEDYALNRKIDATVRAFTWNDFESLLKKAQLQRRSRLLQVAKETVGQAKADWPALLKDVPDGVQKSVMERLNGGVEIAK